MTCPCGSGTAYEKCCGAYHAGTARAPTAEALMRSRYSAFVKGEIEYLEETTWHAARRTFDRQAYANRASQSLWLGLEVKASEDGQESDTRGTVTFTARFMVDGQVQEQSEKSLFRKKGGRWYYVQPLE